MIQGFKYKKRRMNITIDVRSYIGHICEFNYKIKDWIDVAKWFEY